MNKLVIIFLLITNIGCSFIKTNEPSEDLKKYLDQFVDSEWGIVHKAKDSLMVYDKELIPYLIDLMEEEKRFVRLKNTGDLIYPGATKYYGHGWFIPYDLDWIAIRAGWVFEELTFQNFGFVENSITDADLIQLHKENYEEYVKTGKHEVNFERESFKKLESSVNNVTDWWILNQDNWTNLSAIKEALYSDDVKRQVNAIHHLRYPRYFTKDLTDEYYVKELLPRIKELANSKDEDVSTQAQMKLGIYKLDI